MKGREYLLGSDPRWRPWASLGAELAWVYIYSRARIICLSFKRHRMFLRELRARKTHIYKQADMALRHNQVYSQELFVYVLKSARRSCCCEFLGGTKDTAKWSFLLYPRCLLEKLRLYLTVQRGVENEKAPTHTGVSG